MSIRSSAGVFVFCLTLCAGGAQAGVVDYTINFTGGGDGVSTIGPGSFSFDSMGVTNATFLPPVTLTDYMVPVSFEFAVGTPLRACATQPAIVCIQVIFTQTSPEDDAAAIDNNGFVFAVVVDSFDSGTGETLQLNNDNTWTIEEPLTPQSSIGIRQLASGTYSINAATAPAPEPASIGLIATGLGTLLLLRRKARPHRG